MIGDYPALKDMPLADLTALMMACALSHDRTDQEFAKACREEIKRRKPEPSISGERK